ncbi:MAG: hypothetical protein RL748_1813 [Pseudomonadota bacterium]
MDNASTLPATRETLQNAIIEADLLLAYAASHGIQLKNEIVATVVQSKQLLDANLLDQETIDQQITFWNVRSDLAQAVQPISAESLKLCTLRQTDSAWLPQWLIRFFGRVSSHSTEVEKTIRKMQLSIVFPIILLLTIQVYAVIGGLLVAELAPLMDKLQSEASELRKESATGNANASGMNELTITLASDGKDIAFRAAMLGNWNAGWDWISMPFRFPAAQQHGPALAQADAQQSLKEKLLKAKFALQVLQNYVLPLLYGCLGAALFVLRSLARDAKEYTFDQERKMGYHQRIYMGTLCGLVIGWFIPDAPVGSAGLTQYSLSILGGYSVDVLFGVMDKIIASLSSTPAQPNQTTQ